MFKKLSSAVLFLIALLALSATCNAYLLQKKVFSGSGASLSWTLSESDLDNAYSFVKDDMYVIHIDNKGEKESDIKVSHSEFSIYKGITYNLTFKLSATKDCKVYAEINEFTEPYSEVWNNSLTPYEIKANEVLAVTQKITTSKDIKNAELSFKFGGILAGETPYDVNIIFAALAGNSPATPTPALERDIRVNQLGYFPDGPKKATLNLKGEEISSSLTWNLKNSVGSVVATGKTIPMGNDHSSGENVHTIDFSTYSGYGKDYQLVVGNAVSYKFDIAYDLYSQMKYDSLKYFYHARSAIKVELPYCVDSKWSRPAGHMKDIATLKPGTGHTGPEALDCTGGWYDNSDHNKYLINGGLTLWLLQNQYEHSKIKGTDNVFLKQLNIPESVNSINDLLDEAKWELEWMFRMQIPSGFEREGMAAHKVADEGWTGLATRPDQDTQNRIYSPPSTAATLNLAACAAQAARIWKDIDSDFSDKCLTVAIKAYNAAKENPVIYVHEGQEIGSLAYGDGYLEDEFYWAACELYATTKKANYLNDLKSYEYCFEIPIELRAEYKGISGCFNCSNTGALGTLSLALVSSGEFPEAIESIKKAADAFINEQKKESYGMPLPESMYISSFYDEKEEVYGYPSESNAYIYKIIILAYAYDFSKDSKYLFSLLESMDYLLGRNANNKSYISGYGDDSIKYPNHRFFCPNADPAFPPVPPGFLVSGPNSSGKDHLTFVLRMKELNFPAQKWYIDNEQSWSTNLMKISLNAGLAWVTYYIDVHASQPSLYFPEDINKDGKINMADIIIIAKAFGCTISDSNFDLRCDLNGDSRINMSDLVKMALKFGWTYELN
jgi:endoglucanase